MLGVITGDKILTQEDISKIKGKMCEIINNNDKITKLNVAFKDAIKFLKIKMSMKS